jgi:4-hydroxybenzoate polyprenyltransferase
MLVLLFRSSHPGPTIAVSLIALALAFGAGLDPVRIGIVTLAILCNQLSTGLSNDWVDAARDRRNERSDKPIATGQLSSTTVIRAAILLAVTSLALSLLLGPLAALANTVFLASGWLYNFGLKSTIASVVPYVIGFGSLPAIVSLADDPAALAQPWAIAAGALLGIAAHFSNVLPDLDDDSTTGVRGLPHSIGSRASGLVIAASLISASLAIVFGSANEIGAVPIIGFTLTVVLAATTIVLVLRDTMKRLLFRLTIAAALINVALLVFSASLLS